jgi:hypothetical protein
MTTIATLMTRIEQHFMEHQTVMHLEEPADIIAAETLKQRGLIDAAISHKSRSKDQDRYDQSSLVIVRRITPEGRAKLANRTASGLRDWPASTI